MDIVWEIVTSSIYDCTGEVQCVGGKASFSGNYFCSTSGTTSGNCGTSSNRPRKALKDNNNCSSTSPLKNICNKIQNRENVLYIYCNNCWTIQNLFSLCINTYLNVFIPINSVTPILPPTVAQFLNQAVLNISAPEKLSPLLRIINMHWLTMC